MTVPLSARELGDAVMRSPRLTMSVLAGAEPPVSTGALSCLVEATKAGLLLSRSRTPSRPGEPTKEVCGAKRSRALAVRMNGLFSERVGRLVQVLNNLYCQVPCAGEAALLTMAMPPRPGE